MQINLKPQDFIAARPPENDADFSGIVEEIECDWDDDGYEGFKEPPPSVDDDVSWWAQLREYGGEG